MLDGSQVDNSVHFAPRIATSHSALVGCLTLFLLPTFLLADESELLKHRWEFEPDLGVSWIFDHEKTPKAINLDHIRGDNRKRCLDQTRRAVIYAANFRFANQHQVICRAVMDRLRGGEPNRQLRLALVSAAVALSDGSEVEELWSRFQADPVVRPIIEPALARLQSPAATAVWRQRIREPHDSGVAGLLVALEGVRYVGDESDREPLTHILREPMPLAVKFCAARALGELCHTGLEALASEILESDEQHAELLGAHVLANHSSESAQSLLLGIVNGDSLPAKPIALNAFASANPKTLIKLAPEMIRHRDSSVRLGTVKALRALQDSSESIRILGQGLADEISAVRIAAREAIIAKGLEKSHPVVVELLDWLLVHGNAFELEQAIHLVVACDDHSRCQRLFELLDHAEYSVSNCAAWALERELQASDKEMLDAVLQRAIAATTRHFDEEEMSVAKAVEVAFLFEIVGKFRVKSADEMLRRYIPKYIAPTAARSSAIWALGYIWEGQAQPKVVSLLTQRLHDYSASDPEDPEVKYTSAIALGMIQHPDSLYELDRYLGRPPDAIGLAREWALDNLPDHFGKSSN